MMKDTWGTLLSLLFFLLILTVIHCDQAENVPDEWYRKEFPNPQIDVEKCGRYGKHSYVCDPNHIITEEEANQLDNIIKGILRDTICPCSANTCDRNGRGYQVSIALLKKISMHPANYPPVTEPTTTPHHKTEKQLEKERIDALDNNLNEANLFATHLLDAWEFGQCEEQVVVLYSVQDNVVYTVTNKHARKKLKDYLVSEIQQNARRNLSPGQPIMTGLRDIILNYKKVFQGNYNSNIIYETKPEAEKLKSGGTFTRLSVTSILASVLSLLFVLLQ